MCVHCNKSESLEALLVSRDTEVVSRDTEVRAEIPRLEALLVSRDTEVIPLQG